jgi:hypothetical protein
LKFKTPYIVILLLLFCSYQPLFGQIQKTVQFELNDFLGERTFLSATQNEELSIYFNTTKGILSYDGHDFNKIKALESLENIKNIISFRNVLYLSNSKSLFQYFPAEDSVKKLANIKVNQFQKFNNQLWLITDDELMILENNGLKSIYKTTKGENLKCFELNNQNTLIGHNKGLTLLSKGEKIKDFGSFLNPSKITSSIFILMNLKTLGLSTVKIL